MTEEEFKKKYYDIIKESCIERRKIVDDAKASGVWCYGLDTNSDLFTEIDLKYQKMIEELKIEFLSKNDN